MTDDSIPRFVVVAGMHRSGTSLVARIVNLLGVDLGPPGSLMEAKPDNPTGFWESLPVAQFNDDLLAELGGQWDDPPVLVDGWEAKGRLDRWRRRASGIVRSEFAGVEVAGWKDPRMSLLLPFWRTVVDIEHVIVVVRDPGAVAGSLAARDGTDPELSAELWLRYTVGALRNAPDGLAIRYQDFFDDFDVTVDSLATALGQSAPTGEVRAEIEDFFDPTLRHHSGHSPSGPVGEAAAWLFRSAWPMPRAALDLLWDGLRELRGAEDSRGSVQALWERTESDRSDLERQLKEAQGKLEELAPAEQRMAIQREALARQERMGQRLRDRLESAETELGEMRKKLSNGGNRREATRQ